MRRSEIRQRIFDLLDYQPDASTDVAARVNRDINRALVELSSDCPSIFNDDIYQVTAHAPFETSGTSDTVRVLGTDSFVIRRSNGISSNDNDWDITGKWRGWVIEIKQPDDDGVWVKRRIMDVWQAAPFPGIITYDYLALDVPWRNTTDTGMEYRIYQEHVFLPNDIRHIRDCHIRDYEYGSRKVNVNLRHDTYDAQLQIRHKYEGQGTPERLFADTTFRLPHPATAPSVTVNSASAGSWSQSPIGSRKYRITYGYGIRDRRLVSKGGFYLPAIESQPSPESSSASIPDDGRSVTAAFTSPEWGQFTAQSTKERYQHSGIKIRIYAAQTSATYGSGNSDAGDASDSYYLVHEGNVGDTSWTDSGVPLDYSCPLRPCGGYVGLGMFPVPESDYLLEFRTVREPLPLTDDDEHPSLSADGEGLLVSLSAAIYARSIGQSALHDRLRAEYMIGVQRLKNAQAILPRVIRRKYARS